MSTRSDSEDLTRVGPGTVMGRFMRQYWLPALKSSELVADGDPVRLMLLGEKLLAFRDTQGQVGVMQHQCPHRCASLFLGRNEEGGIRCTYHGWKFDVKGRCIDMPSVPPDQDFKHKVQAKAYAVAERNGLVWVWMGDVAAGGAAPPLPMIEVALLPEDQVDITFVQRRCNFVQALEGDIDTSHFGFLHVGHVDPDDIPPGHPLEHTVTDRAPQYHVRDTPWGTSYGAHRAVPGEQGLQTYWRFANFMFPCWTQTPQGQFPLHVHARAWVPMDDGHTMFVFIRWRSPMPTPRTPLKNGQPLAGSAPSAPCAPAGTGWYDRFRLVADESNDWHLSREDQRSNRIWCGIDNIHLQDQAVTESMGPITDHDLEHLGPGDLMIARTRRRLLQAARRFAETGEPPPGVADPQVFLASRSGYFLADPAVDWLDAYAAQVQGCVRPAKPESTAAQAVPAE